MMYVNQLAVFKPVHPSPPSRVFIITEYPNFKVGWSCFGVKLTAVCILLTLFTYNLKQTVQVLTSIGNEVKCISGSCAERIETGFQLAYPHKRNTCGGDSWNGSHKERYY